MPQPDVPPPSEPVAHAVRDRVGSGPPAALQRAMLDLQDAGLAPSLVERVLSWWSRFGGRRAAALAVAVVLPLLRYEYVPYVMSSAVETLAEGYGVRLEVGAWETSLTDIRIVGKDVTITTAGSYRERRLFHADAVEFDWSLVRGLANGWRRVRTCWTAVFLQPCTVPDEVFHRVVVDGATLHLERSLSGGWNAEDAFAVDTLDGLAEVVGRWRIPVIEGRDVSVSWVEQLRGDSGGGLLEQRYSNLDFTKVTIGLANLQLQVDDRANPTRLTFDGQTADGQVSVRGAVNVSRWAEGAWAPSYDLTFELDNVGAAALGRIASPEASVVPREGTVDGTVRIAHDGTRPTVCQIDLALRNVAYGVNPRSPYSRIGGQALVEQLEPLRVTDGVSRDCLGPPAMPDAAPQPMPEAPATERRVTATIQTLVTRDALDTAPPLVRGAAAFDEDAVIAGRTPTTEELAEEMTRQFGRAIAGERGAAVASALTSRDSSGGNAVSRGARSLGRGIRRLFGGGGNDKPAANRSQRPPAQRQPAQRQR